MEVDLGGSANVGEEGSSLQQQHQLRTLAQLIGDRPLPHDALRLLDKGDGKKGTIPWQRTRHALGLFLFTTLRLIGNLRTLPRIPAQPYN